ncbi:MAG: hypothetical protein EA343_21485 [Nodularia sp. (in: Bacteria)]|nr:MAG: hypothetical protein EA343_21485 [Nodularia sp. (in: cyanobacteria)]
MATNSTYYVIYSPAVPGLTMIKTLNSASLAVLFVEIIGFPHNLLNLVFGILEKSQVFCHFQAIWTG